jgi:hypothetical protein
MPWWAHRIALEGLLWEQPWIARVEMVEGVDRSEPVQDDEFAVGEFVGVKPR